MNPGAVALSADPRAATEKILRAAVQKGVISAESDTLRYFGVDTALVLPSDKFSFTSQENQSMNMENREEKSGRELSETNAKELAAHVSNIERGLEGIKSFLAGKGYDLKDFVNGDKAGAEDSEEPVEEKALTLEEIYGE
jgi:hypothetical protein